MNLEIREDKVVIDGYVNAVERNSRPLKSRLGQFVERIQKGAFTRALERNDDVAVLLNHDPTRRLGGTKEGNLKLKEDAIGLHARAEITDPEVIDEARNGNLVGWSFGFYDIPGGVTESVENGMRVRSVGDMDLREVSIIDRRKRPAYEGTLIMARDDEQPLYGGEVLESEVVITDETRAEQAEQPDTIDYTKWEKIIEEMKEEQAT